MIHTLHLDTRHAPRAADPDASAPDAYTVPPEHEAVHARLENWGRWVRRSGGASPACSPMFRLYRPSNAREMAPPAPSFPPDPVDALLVERAVRGLPERPREALRWFYCFTGTSPSNCARYLGLRPQALPALVAEGRAMLRARTY